MELVAFLVFFLLAIPNILIWVAAILIIPAVLILSSNPRRVKETFWCPLAGRAVSADFLVPKGAERPTDVASCTVFANPGLITCGKVCIGAMKLTVSGLMWQESGKGVA